MNFNSLSRGTLVSMLEDLTEEVDLPEPEIVTKVEIITEYKGLTCVSHPARLELMKYLNNKVMLRDNMGLASQHMSAILEILCN